MIKNLNKRLRMALNILDLRSLIFRTDISRKETVRRLLFSYFAISSILFFVPFGIHKAFMHEFSFAVVLILSSVINCIILFYCFRKFKTTKKIMVINTWVFAILSLSLLIRSAPTGYMAMWLYLFPAFSYVILDLKDALICNLMFLVGVFVICYLQEIMPVPFEFDTVFRMRFILTLNAISALSYISEVIRFRYEQRMIRQQRKLEAEKEKLSHAKTLVENASRVKTEFLGNMSHELRTPLNHIIGFGELIGDKNIGELNDIQKEYLDDVLLSAKHLLDLIDDTLDLSNAFNGELEVSYAATDISLLLENVIQNQEENAKKRNITQHLQISDIPEHIHADAQMLKKIFSHLLLNALKYTQNNGNINIVVSSGNGNSNRINQPDAECINISVKDDGIGIAEQDLKRIFQPFEQVESSASRKYAGTGLGLSLARQLVAVHNGDIWAESDGLGKGATFQVVLPVAQNSSKLKDKSSKLKANKLLSW